MTRHSFLIPPKALLLSLAFGTLLVGCDKKDSPAPKPEAQKPAAQGNAEETKKDDATPGGTTLKLKFTELLSEKAREGMKAHPRTVAPKADWLAELDQANPKPSPRKGAPLPFTRLDAGRGFFCGTLKNGPVRCWGRRDDFVAGGYVDIAVAGDAVCAVAADGTVKCLDQEAPPLTNIKRIAGSGNHFCALEKSGKVHCFSLGGEPLVPNATLEARYIAVGLNFACAGNQSRMLECWGKTDHLDLPSNLAIKDIASTDLGICAIKEDQTIQCFGQKNLDFGSDKFTAVNGGFGTLCAKRDGVDETVCKGALSDTYKKPSQRVAATLKTLCALTPDGTPECQGPAFGPEISIPRTQVNEPSKTEVPHFKEFLDLFPTAKLPFDLTRKGSFEVGAQPAEKFYQFLDSHPSKYRVIAKFEEPVTSVLVYNWDAAHVQFYTYDKLGNIVRFRTMASSGGGTHYDAMEFGDGRTQENSSYHSTETMLTADGKIEQTKYNRQETSHFLAPRADGTRPISRIECVIMGTHSVDQIQPDGTFKRLEAKVLPTHAETDLDGCGDMWPNGYVGKESEKK